MSKRLAHNSFAAQRRARRAFTLPELVVAVGAAAILTAAAGVLFRSVGDLASSGVSSVQLDATARAIEAQLRDDFAALSRLRHDESFFAIRYREIGDIDRTGTLSPNDGERAVYLAVEDREADLDLEVDPYARDASGTPLSRAITTRLDDMVFLGEDEYRSVLPGARPAEAQHARIYWGHGLRPRPDPDYTPGEGNYLDIDTSLPRAPIRQYIPDGDFGVRAGDSFEFDAQTLISTGRNEYATGWSLSRQAALLYGGDAFRFGESSIGSARYAAPYLRDTNFYESDRFNALDGFFSGQLAEFGERPETDDPLRADPRWLQGGRVDIVAQTRDDVQRWFEGELPPPQNPPPNPSIDDATAYSFGPFVNQLSTLTGADGSPVSIVTRPLWLRSRDVAFGAGQIGSAIENMFSVQAAIAGVFLRPLVDDRVSLVVERRHDPLNLVGDEYRDPPGLEFMDSHSIMGARVSRFEIAWSDGTSVVAPDSSTGPLPGIDINQDGATDLYVGDLIWFDITPVVNPDGDILRRNTYSDWIEWSIANPERIRFPDPRVANAPSLLAFRNNPRNLFPEIFEGINNLLTDTSMGGGSLVPLTTRNFPPFYDTLLTGAPMRDDGSFGPEMHAIWGFREPLPNGQYGRPWEKPKYIRVRMTLHDGEVRNVRGKDYEFLYTINPAKD